MCVGLTLMVILKARLVNLVSSGSDDLVAAAAAVVAETAAAAVVVMIMGIECGWEGGKGLRAVVVVAAVFVVVAAEEG